MGLERDLDSTRPFSDRDVSVCAMMLLLLYQVSQSTEYAAAPGWSPTQHPDHVETREKRRHEQKREKKKLHHAAILT